MTLKKTVLHPHHEREGAKLVEFAGFSMPLHYGDVRTEHMAVRQSMGMFDISHMGEVIVEGQKSLDFLQWVLSNDVSKLRIGQAQYNYMPNLQGGIVDDLVVYRLSEHKYMLVINAANIEKDLAWLQQHNKFACSVIDMSEQYALIAVQGPKTVQVLNPYTSLDVSSIQFYNYEFGEVCGIQDVLISATGYTGSGGFEFYVQTDKASDLWSELLSVKGMQCCGLGSRDTLRLEKGYCLYGNDIDDNTNPFEAGLGWITKLGAKESLAQDILVEAKGNQSQKLVGFIVKDKRIARQGATVWDKSLSKEIGRVTSGSLSPMRNEPIGMAYVDLDYLSQEKEFFINVGRKNVLAQVVKLPFV